MEIDRGSAAVRVLCRRLLDLEVDVDIYVDYLIGILEGDSEGDGENARDDCVEALSAVVEADAARNVIEELLHNIKTKDEVSGVIDEGCDTDELSIAASNASGLTEDVIESDELAGDSPQVVETPTVCSNESITDVARDMAAMDMYGIQVDGDGDVESSLAFDDAALAEYLGDADHQQWWTDTSMEAEESIFDMLKFHYARSCSSSSPDTVILKGGHELQDTRRPCIFFMSGSCLRADCQFSHDLANIACKYWASGSCLRGDDCPFSHSTAADDWKSSKSSEVYLSDADFPALSSTADPRIGSTSMSSDQSWSEKVTAVAPAGKTSLHHTKAGGQSLSHARSRRANPVKWVAVGDELSQLYEDLRHQATAHGSSRNKCFQNALEAFRAGDKAAARRFSIQGRRHDEEMKRLHEKAAEEMFNARNSGHAKNVIDLHGLHVPEALDRLDKFLVSLESACKGRPQHAFIITGTGHHSIQSGYKAKLQPAIVKELKRRGLPAYDCSKDARGGLLQVAL